MRWKDIAKKACPPMPWQRRAKPQTGNQPLAKTLMKGIGRLVSFVVDMEKRGVSEVVEQGELIGKTKGGKDIKVKYGYGVKIGLDGLIKKLKNR